MKRQDQVLSKLPSGLIVASAVVCALLTAATLTPSTAHAAGAVGNGGAPGGGGADSIATDYGYGWYQFAVDAAVTPRNGAFTQPWANINKTCKDLGARSIVTYVVFRASGGLGNSVVFNYPGWPDTFPGARGNGPFPWMTVGEAKAKYDSSDFDKTGYTWGVNVGWFCYDFGSDWTINGQSYIEKGATPNRSRQSKGPITASVGETLNWYHDLRNNGPDAMDKEIFHVIDKTGFTGAWNSNQPTGWASGVRNELFVRIYATTGSPYTRYTVTQNDVGKTLCQRIAWRDASSSVTGVWGRAAYTCANIPYSYQLTPSMTINPASVIEPGETSISIDAMMRNVGSTKSRQVSSMTTRLVIPRGTSLPTGVTTSTYSGGGDITQAACAHFTVPGRKACDVQTRNVAGHVFPADSNTQLPGGRYDDDISGINLEVGDRLCYVASVNQYSVSAGTNAWRHSAVQCVDVSMSPKVLIKGGDLLVGRAIGGAAGMGDAKVSTGTTLKDGRVFGSWVEYGIFAPGNVVSASGAALAGATGGDAGMQDLRRRNALTFENRGDIGVFGDTGTAGDLRERFVTTNTNCGTQVTTYVGTTTPVYQCGNISIRGNVPIGRSAVIKASRITITGDITYANGTVSSISDIPQLVLIADQIIINDNVRRVDAWLVADQNAGHVTTCQRGRTGNWNPASPITGANGLSVDICNEQVQINGPIMAKKLFLRRTAGTNATNDTNSFAEVINMRGDAYLWAAQQGANSSQIMTTYTRDLAPRF